MRKNMVKILGVMIISVMLAGCGNTASKVDQVIQSQMQKEDGKGKETNTGEKDETPGPTAALKTDATDKENSVKSVSNENIDVDLTKLSSTMVYSEVYNMLYAPQDYIGKTVKMRGMFVTYTNQDESQYYPAVIIADATACCSQGLEFLLEGNPPYPEGYPKMETEITVIGTFETYDEEGYRYCHLVNATFQ